MTGRARTALLVNLATIVERADEQVLPAVYKALGHSLNASLSQLGALTTCRALVQTLSSPLSGCLGDRYDRTLVIAAGCFIWGAMTSLIGISTSLHEAMIWCAVNGLGLALVIPCSQSLIADYYHADSRGQAFGLMAFTGAVGGLLGGFFATNVGHMRILGLDGWRFAFHLVALISLAVGVGVVKLAVDPRYTTSGAPTRLKHKQSDMESLLPQVDQASKGFIPASDMSHDLSTPRYSLLHTRHPASPAVSDSFPLPSVAVARSSESRPSPTLRASAQSVRPASRGSHAFGPTASVSRQVLQQALQIWADVRWMLGLRTFQIIVAQGILGCFPWQAMVFFTLWLQLQGFSDFAASMLMAIFAAGAALGGWLGGVIGDRMAMVRPNAGRIMTAQCSVVSGLPLTWLLLKGLPASSWSQSAPAYAVVMFLLGLMCTWCGSGCNSPIFAEVVPAEMRSTVYAFDRSFENAIASCAAPVVGILAERVFKFQGTLASTSEMGAEVARANAAALANSLAVCMLVPWSICLVCFSGLYWVYPRDKLNAGGMSRAAVGLKRAADVKSALL